MHYYLWPFNHWLYSENTLDKQLSWPFSVIGPSNISAATTQPKHEAQFLWQSKLSSTMWDCWLWSSGLWVLWEKMSPPMLCSKCFSSMCTRINKMKNTSLGAFLSSYCTFQASTMTSTLSISTQSTNTPCYQFSMQYVRWTSISNVEELKSCNSSAIKLHTTLHYLTMMKPFLLSTWKTWKRSRIWSQIEISPCRQNQNWKKKFHGDIFTAAFKNVSSIS